MFLASVVDNWDRVRLSFTARDIDTGVKSSSPKQVIVC